jgi:hypothetical protein
MPAGEGGVADLLENFQEQRLLALEMPIENRFRDTGGMRDLLGRRVLIA